MASNMAPVDGERKASIVSASHHGLASEDDAADLGTNGPSERRATYD